MKTILLFTTLLLWLVLLSNTSQAQWVPTGGPYGGDIRCLLSSGTLVFAGVNGGGIYVSTDKGLTWTARNSGLDDPEVYALAVKGTFTKTYFAGTSTGVSYSANSGISWTTSLGLPESYVSALLVSGTDLFAATWGNGVYRSTDNGVSWFASTTGITSLYTLSMGVIGSNLFVGTYDGGIFRSTDNGTSWTPANTGLTTTLVSTFVVDGTNIYAGGSPGVFLSTDNGTTWASISTGFPASPGVYFLKFNGTTLYAASQKGLYSSTNYGSNWSLVVPNVNIPQECYLALAVNSGYLFAGSIGSGIFRTTDNGVTWTSNNVGIKNFLTTSIDFKGNNLYASSSYDGVFLSTDEGDSWSAVNNGLTNKAVMTLVNLDNFLYAGTSGSGIFRSSDDGANWSACNNGITNTSYVPYDFVASDTNIYTAVYGSGVFVSSDNGDNWAASNTGLTNLAATCMLVNGADIYTGTWQGGVFRSTDGGANWTAVNNGFPTPSSKAISCLIASGSNIIAATASGLYLTTDNGSSWSFVTYGVTNEWYGTLAKSGSNIFTSNHNGGVFLSNDNGANWVSVTTGISPIMPIYKFKFNSTHIFAGIFGYSVWKRPLVEFGNGPGLISNPSPADSATNVGIENIALSWTNPIGTTANKVYFGKNPQSLSLIYNDTVVNTVNTPSPLSYTTTYYWKVDAISSTGTTIGRTYTFSTLDDPNAIFFDNFETGLAKWTITNQGTGIGIWKIYTPPYPTSYGVYTLPATSSGGVLAADSRDFHVAVLSTATITNVINALLYQNVELQFDNDWRTYITDDQAYVEISTDSSTWTPVWSKLGVSLRNTHEIVDLSPLVAHTKFWLRFRSVQPDWDYWWAIDNITINAWNTVPVTTFQLSVDVNAGWNMVSTPGLHPVDQGVDTWWPFKALNSSVFQFNGSYQAVTVAENGKGYWMRHSDVRTYNTGDEWPAGGITIVPNNPIPGNAGWNMIGCYNYNVATSGITTSAGTVLGSVFGYSGGYNPVTTLLPGYGYWIRLSEAANIILPNASFKGAAKIANINDKWGKIILTDKAGRNYTLYAADSKTDLSQFDMPPAPPAGMMDVRYSSQRYVENITDAVQTIDFNGMEYPVTVTVEKMSIKLQDLTAKAINTILKPGEKVTINNSQIDRLMVSGNTVPTEYSLDQNYPNPFNPSTKINYSLAKDSRVTLEVYSITGERVAQIVNQEQSAGYYTINFGSSTFDGKLASGVYIYRLNAVDKASGNNFSSVKKMIMLK